jgi:diguanylate cyclase (GGDEF)-like protein
VAPDTALDHFPDPVISTDSTGHVVRWNVAAVALLQIAAERALGQLLNDVVEITSRDDMGRHPKRKWARTGHVTVAVEITAWRMPGVGDEHHLCLRDVTQRVAEEADVARAEEVLRRQARFDALTGPANRYELEERLAQALADTHDGQLACVVVDLDGFKPINDSFGHAVGDEVLAAVAARLKSAVRDRQGRALDTVARLGGDEFVILTSTSRASPSAIVERVRDALAGPITTTAGPLSIGASVGIATSLADGDAADLLRRADKAMFRSKLARGGNGLG